MTAPTRTRSASPPRTRPAARPPVRFRGPSDLLREWLAGGRKPKNTLPPMSEAAIGASALTILTALLFGFVAQVLVVGTLQHNRNQQIAYDDLRLALAEGTAPVGPVDGVAPGKGTPLARLSIPAIGVSEIVLEGTTSSVLRSGIGHRRDTVYPGQAGTSVLMGRRLTYGGPFGQLGSLQIGDEIRVLGGQGEATYQVSAVRQPGDVERRTGVARLTLITTSGTKFAPSDVVRVDADLVGTPFTPATPMFSPSTLPVDERELKGEPRALKGMVGWGVLLCAAAVGVQWLRIRWGRWQSWLIAIPTLGLFGIEVADYAARLLPNVL